MNGDDMSEGEIGGTNVDVNGSDMSEGEVGGTNVDMNEADMSDGEVVGTNVDVNEADISEGEVNDLDLVGSEANDSDDVSVHYDNALDVAFQHLDKGSDNDGLIEDDIGNLLGYAKGTNKKKHKGKRDFNEGECEDDGEELESGCETDDESSCNRNKYHVFKMPKNMSGYINGN